MLVAVYGTLKRGYSNNRILRNSTFVAEGVVRGFKLFDSSFPVAAPSDNDCIRVEVFDIGEPGTPACDNTLYNLDALEGYRESMPESSMYHRKEVQVICDNGVTTTGNMYVGNPLFWRDFKGMREEPKDDSGMYYWHR